MIDYTRLTTLQQALLRESLETTPAEVTAFSLLATNTEDSMQLKVNASTPFVLSEKATATLRDIFELHRADA